jgi:hypothetical protein
MRSEGPRPRNRCEHCGSLLTEEQEDAIVDRQFTGIIAMIVVAGIFVLLALG